MKLHFTKLITFCFLFSLTLTISPPVFAASVPVTGKAKIVNTDNSYLDFTSYNSNIVVNDSTGDFSGYAFLEDVGWVAFGTTDNTQGPVSVNLTTGAVTGKAKVLLTENFLDFTNYNSTVTVNVSTGVFSGYVFSEDIGWINFGDSGVNTNNAPNSFTLDSPGVDSYTDSARPRFRWRTTTGAIGSIANYSIEIDNDDTQDLSIADIPVERSDDYVTTKYTARYDGFSDDAADNDYISVSTLSSDEWASTDNDGKIKEGKRTWYVTARDHSGNELVESRDLYVDLSSPNVVLSKVNSTELSSDTISMTDTTPTILGTVTDSLAGDPTTDKVASGPKKVEVKMEKKDVFGAYSLHGFALLNMKDSYWTFNDQKITDNTEQKSDKYAPFSFTPGEALPIGTYRVTFTGKDNAGNSGLGATFMLQVNTTFSNPFSFLNADGTEVTQTSQSIEMHVENMQPISQVQGLGIFKRLTAFTTKAFNWVGNAAKNMLAFASNTARTGTQTVGKLFAYASGVTQATIKTIAGSFMNPWQIAPKVQHWFAFAVGSYSEIVLDHEPTRITDVKVIEVGFDYAIIEWNTNHYTTNNKINWGENTSYGSHAFAEDFTKVHRVRLGNLKPETKYAFEVMSQNKNYIYDSFHEFVTKSQE